MPAAVGCQVVFADDQYPACRPLSQDEIASLQAPADIAQCFPMREIIRQVREINAQYH